MKLENRNLLINGVVALVVGLLFLLAFQMAYPDSKYPEYDGLFKNASEINSVEFDTFGLVYDRLEVIKGGETVGYIYKGKGQNQHSGTGYIDIQIGIDASGKITGIEFLELSQTDFVLEKIETNTAYYVDKNISELELAELAKEVASYDVESGASRGTGVVRNILREAIMIHTGGLDVTPYLSLFPTADQVTPVALTGNTYLYQKLEVSAAGTVLGYIYQGKDRNFYSADGEYIDMMIGVNPLKVIVGIEFLALSQSSFKLATIEANAAFYEGKALSEIDTNDLMIVLSEENPYDVQTGATKGTYIVRTILEEMIRLHEGLTQPTESIAQIFPNYDATKTVVDATFVPTAEVLSKTIVKDADDVVIGYLYELFGENEVGGGDHYEPADLKVLVGLNATQDKVVKVLLPEADFNQTSSFYQKAVGYANHFTALAVTSINTIGYNYAGTDMTTGASQTPTLVRDLLDALVEVL